MGFFENTKPPPPPPVIVHQTKKDGLTAIIDGIFSIAAILFTTSIAVIAFVAKPIFGYLLTFEGRSQSQIRKQLTILVLLLFSIMYLVYQIQWVRDLSLSRTHTINISNGERIFFPDRQYFVPRSSSQKITFGSLEYVTYSGYTGSFALKLSNRMCQMVYRGEQVTLASKNPPIQAEGFDDEVEYPVTKNLTDLFGWRYWHERLLRPNDWLKMRRDMTSVYVTYNEKSSWDEFIRNWADIPTMKNDDHKPFELKAKSREHAVICF